MPAPVLLVASRSSVLGGSLDGVDGPDGVDVATSVATLWAGGGGRRYHLRMAFDLRDGFDPAELWAEKQRVRDEDQRALDAGEKTIAQLRHENEVFAQLTPLTRINLASSKSLG